jgi:peptidyl-prolyl cis-trans isomerase B (cyclophilin B)
MGRANSGGAQFFICLSPQPSLDSQFSAFGQVTEGIDVAEKISLAQTDANQLTASPVKIISVKIEPKKTEPFKDATVDQLRKDVLLRTTMGEITVELDPDIAPEHVRNFLKLVETGWYDHTAFHRIIPGFVIQGGIGSTRAGGAAHPADRWVRKLKGEFSNRLHVRGILSMARTDDPDSAETSFFIVLGAAPHLDGKYTVFGKVVDGFDTLERIEKVQREGERPVERIELIEAAIKP